MRTTFIVAEIANMHEGSLGLAKKIIEAAVRSGADAVKLQTHIFETESLINAPMPSYFQEESRESYLKRTAFDVEQYRHLKSYTEALGAQLMSAPFSIEAIDLLEKVGFDITKVPSGEVNNLPYLKRLARTRKEVFLPCGMSTWDELDEAVKALRENGCSNLTVLQCTSEYPCTIEHVGLNVLAEIRERYGVSVGLSDHTLSLHIPAAAVVLGAQVIEKHFTLSRMMYGPDAKHSLPPDEFEIMVRGIREVEKALNSEVDKDVMARELQEMKIIFEKSIVAACELKAGTVIEEKHLAYKKPADGIKAKEYQKTLGKVLQHNIGKNHKFQWSDFA